MSYTETPEQRQIRILRNSISSMRSDNDRLSSQNRRLEREMELVRRQQQCVRWVLQVRLHMIICSRETEMRHIETGSLMLFII